MTPTAPPFSDPALAALRRDTLRRALACALGLGLAASALSISGTLGPGFAGKALAVFALGCCFMLRGLPGHLPHARFGAGNQVTLGRLALIGGLAACIGEALAGGAVWALVVVATVAALLDAIDGALARAAGLTSGFGARFDMECDALLILVLSALVVQTGKTGAWVLAAGLMRYAFVAAAAFWPWLARPLPASRRRQAVCAAQIACLIVCLGPVVAPWAAQAVAGASLAALAASFAVDVLWLARQNNQPETTAP